jgi:hypothetical protein
MRFEGAWICNRENVEKLCDRKVAEEKILEEVARLTMKLRITEQPSQECGCGAGRRRLSAGAKI